MASSPTSASSSSADRPTDYERQATTSPFFKRALGAAEGYVKQPLRIKQLLNDSYKKAAAKKDIGSLAADAWESLQTLFRMIGAAVGGRYHGIPTSVMVGATAVLLYFLSPIDAIPDFIPVIGLLDDVALMAWFTGTIKEEMDRFAAWERTTGAGAADSHVALTARPQSADLGTEQTGHPTPAATRDPSVRAFTTDGSRDASRRADTAGGDPGGNVR